MTSPFSSNTDKLFCLGGAVPGPEQCDGLDHDCNGTPSDVSTSCYSGPIAQINVGRELLERGVEEMSLAPAAVHAFEFALDLGGFGSVLRWRRAEISQRRHSERRQKDKGQPRP